MDFCKTCSLEMSKEEMISLATVRPVIFELIKKDFPEATKTDFICISDLNKYRYGYVESIIKNGSKNMTHVQKSVSESILNNQVVSAEPFENLTFGERVSDKMASFGGSWKFILSFATILICWIMVNIIVLTGPFDPYPFILLNLVLSCLAAIQAPVIMMSQNRQEAKDRQRATNDYKINLKSELEVRQLHQKIDHLMSTQWEQMNEILDILKEIDRK